MEKEFTTQELQAAIETLKTEKLRHLNVLQGDVQSLQADLDALDRVGKRLLQISHCAGPKPTTHRTGPEPTRLKIEGTWEDAVKKSLTVSKPPEGWPR
jgi:hypothetical protein